MSRSKQLTQQLSAFARKAERHQVTANDVRTELEVWKGRFEKEQERTKQVDQQLAAVEKQVGDQKTKIDQPIQQLKAAEAGNKELYDDDQLSPMRTFDEAMGFVDFLRSKGTQVSREQVKELHFKLPSYCEYVHRHEWEKAALIMPTTDGQDGAHAWLLKKRACHRAKLWNIQ